MEIACWIGAVGIKRKSLTYGKLLIKLGNEEKIKRDQNDSAVSCKQWLEKQ